jgi:hypothetical protein
MRWICGGFMLFYDAINISDYITSNGRVGELIDRYLKGNDGGIIKGTLPTLASN